MVSFGNLKFVFYYKGQGMIEYNLLVGNTKRTRCISHLKEMHSISKVGIICI